MHKDEGTEEQRSLLSDLSGADAAAAAPAPSAPRARPRTQTLLIAAVLASSAGIIYAMRQYGMGAGMTFTTPSVTYEPDKALAKLSEGQVRVLAELALSATLVQGEDSIEKNPFRLDPGSAALPLAQDDIPIDDEGVRRALEAEKARQARVAAAERAFAAMKLSSVLMGRVPLARINEQMLRVGDTISDFRVVEIRAESVRLEAEGELYTLMIDHDSLR